MQDSFFPNEHKAFWGSGQVGGECNSSPGNNYFVRVPKPPHSSLFPCHVGALETALGCYPAEFPPVPVFWLVHLQFFAAVEEMLRLSEGLS